MKHYINPVTFTLHFEGTTVICSSPVSPDPVDPTAEFLPGEPTTLVGL